MRVRGYDLAGAAELKMRLAETTNTFCLPLDIKIHRVSLIPQMIFAICVLGGVLLQHWSGG